MTRPEAAPTLQERDECLTISSRRSRSRSRAGTRPPGPQQGRRKREHVIRRDAKAAETAGVSIEEFGKLSEKTQQAYIELSKRVSDGSQQIVGATREVQQAAASGVKGTQELGGGFDEVSEKSGISSREMRGLGKIMGALGAGEAAHLALSFQKVGASLGVVGVAALAFAAAAGAFVKFARDAAEAAKGMEDLSTATGASVQSLKLQAAAFASAGVAATVSTRLQRLACRGRIGGAENR